jgi:hypothetical protein
MRRWLLSVLALLLCVASPASAAVTGWAIGNYLSRNAAVWPGQLPYLATAWIHLPLSSATRNVFSLGTAATVNNQRRLYLSTTHFPTAQSRTTVGVQAVSTTAVTASTWYFVGAAFVGDAARDVYVNTNKISSTSTNIPTAPNAWFIGIEPGLSDPFTNTGGIGEVTMWDLAGLTGADIDNLVAELATLQGATSARNPLAINAQAQPWAGKLVAYWRLTNNTDLTDLTTHGHNLTMIGTLTTYANTPPVDAVPAAGPAARGMVID